MRRLKFTMNIDKLEGFSEAEFINAISKSLEGLYVKALRYGEVSGGYRFEIDFDLGFTDYAYQPILGCFTSIEEEYNKVKLIGIPLSEISMI